MHDLRVEYSTEYFVLCRCLPDQRCSVKPCGNCASFSLRLRKGVQSHGRRIFRQGKTGHRWVAHDQYALPAVVRGEFVMRQIQNTEGWGRVDGVLFHQIMSVVVFECREWDHIKRVLRNERYHALRLSRKVRRYRRDQKGVEILQMPGLRL